MKLRLEQLSARLNAALAPVYVVYGDEPLLVQEASETIRAAARDRGYAERECLTVESGFDWSTLLRAADSLSLFAARRILELHLGSVKPGDAGTGALRAYADRPAEHLMLLVVCSKLDAAAQKSRWLAALDRVGVLVQVWPVEGRQLPAWVERRMRARGLRPDAETVALLAERVEGNLLAAAQEIEKLGMLFGAGGRIRAQQLLDVIGDSARFRVYDLVDAALEGRAGRVVRLLNGIRGEGLEPAVVCWALHREIRLLALLAFAVEDGLALETALARHKVWEKRKPPLRRALLRLRLNTCRGLLRQCARVDRLVKGVEKGDAWDALLELGLCLAGRPVLMGTDDD